MQIVRRGAQQISDTVAYRAHLASTLRLENVGLLLGAGASVSAGGKVVKDVWNDFVDNYPNQAQWLFEQGFVEQEDIAHDGVTTPNVEKLADSLGVAIVEWTRVKNAALADAVAARASLHRAVVRAALLDSAWWPQSVGPGLDEKLRNHRTVLQKLTAARQPGQASPWVFTTNYDLSVEWSAESLGMPVINGFVGTHSRRFSPQSFDLGFRYTQGRGEARFGAYNIYLAKLHGSLTWEDVGGQYVEKQASGIWPLLADFIDGRQNSLSSLVLPSAAKYVQTVGFVLGELLRRFAEFLARPQTCLLVAGYSFGDEHINRLLLSAMLNPTLQLVVYLPEFSGDGADPALPLGARNLLALQSPRVCFVGGGAEAYFDAVARDLPDPSIYDEGLEDIARRLRAQTIDDGGAA